jgi:hypothetical protein
MFTIDLQLLMAALLIGFASGYAVRELKSRQKRRRVREKYWYGPPPIRANKALQRSMPTSSHGALTNGALSKSYPQSQKAGVSAYP